MGVPGGMFQTNIWSTPMHGTNISQIDLNLLVSLDALLRERNVTRTAASLGLSQSAMSHQLRRLREFFSDPLLVAGAGGMVATPLAESLEIPVRRSLADLSRAIEGRAKFEPKDSQRVFHVATKDLVELLGVLPLLTMMSEQAPGVSLHGHAISSATASALENGELDLAIGPDLESEFHTKYRGVRHEVLDTCGWICVLRKGHPATKTRLTFKRYLALRHIRIGASESEWSPDRSLAERGKQRTIAASLPHTLSALHIVSMSDLSVTMPLEAVRPLLPLIPLELVALPFKGPERSLVMSWHERFDQEPASLWLRAAVRSITEAMT